jgi:hypothetical protein
MLKFFRRIRQNLLKEGHLKKYLIYGIGEILLVVIGILIALKVNNWSEDQKRNVEEQATLEKLQIESEAIVHYLNIMYTEYEDIVHAIDKSALALRDKSLNNLNEDEFAYGVYSTAYYEAISPPKNAYNQLNSTGKIQNIKSETVKKSISDYYSYLEYISTQLVYFRIQFTKPVDQAGEDFIYIYNDTVYSKIKTKINFNRLVENKIFISKHVKSLRDQIAFNRTRKVLLDKAIQMCTDISKELDIECTIKSSIKYIQ